MKSQSTQSLLQEDRIKKNEAAIKERVKLVKAVVPKIIQLETKMNLIGDSFGKEKDDEMEETLAKLAKLN